MRDDHVSLRHCCSITAATFSSGNESLFDGKPTLAQQPTNPQEFVEGQDSMSYMGICRLTPSSPHRRIDIKMYPSHKFAFALLYFTGSDHFNRRWDWFFWYQTTQKKIKFIWMVILNCVLCSMRLFAHKKGYSLSDQVIDSVIKIETHTHTHTHTHDHLWSFRLQTRVCVRAQGSMERLSQRVHQSNAWLNEMCLML